MVERMFDHLVNIGHLAILDLSKKRVLFWIVYKCINKYNKKIIIKKKKGKKVLFGLFIGKYRPPSHTGFNLWSNPTILFI
jgi:hypothetical protein